MPVITTFLARDLLDGSWLMKTENTLFLCLYFVIECCFSQLGKMTLFFASITSFNYTLITTTVNLDHSLIFFENAVWAVFDYHFLESMQTIC